MRQRSADDALVQSIIRWDIRNWSRALPFWQRRLDVLHPRRALAIGEGGGGLSLWLATQGIEVVCTDLDVPFEAAKRLHQQFGVGHLVTYEHQDVTDITHPDGSFDLVMFKSVIGALGTKERQVRAVGEMHRVLAPGGMLLFAENLAATPLHRLLRRRFVPWGREWRYLHREADLDLFAPFDQVTVEAWGVVGLLGRTEAQRDLLGRIDSLIVPRTPQSWRYIMFGACRKRVA